MANPVNPNISTGSAVADQLQEILAQKRAEARQALLDSLHAKDVESNIKFRDENMQSLKQQREASAENQKAQEIQRRAGLYSPNQPMAAGDQSFFSENAPSLVDPSQPGTAPLAPGDSGPEMPAKPARFHGLPVQIENQRQLQLQEDLQKLMMDPTKWDAMPDVQKEALYRGAYKSSVPENVLRPKVGGKVLIYDPENNTLIDQQTGQKATSKGPNDTIINRSRAPQVATPTVSHVGNTPDGEPLFQTNKLDKNGLPVLMKADGTPYKGKIVPKTGDKASKAIITPGEAVNYAKLRGKATDQAGGLGGLLPTVKAKESDKAAFAQLENDLYGRFPTDISIAVKDAIKAEAGKDTSNEDIVKKALSQGVIVPGEEAMFYQLLSTVR